ncbi:MAG: SUMF1/EgtB/PvdO family nonheme iron enzyme, partial [Myxococcota bacterium]
ADQPAVDPFLAPDGRPLRVVRGGSWRNSAWSVRAAYRFAFDRDARRDSLGFRVSRGPAE